MILLALALAAGPPVASGPAVRFDPPAVPGVSDPYRMTTYTEAWQAVLRGERVRLFVGVPPAGAGSYPRRCHVDSLPGTAPGVWDCYLFNGGPIMVPVEPPTAMPAPPVAVIRSVSPRGILGVFGADCYGGT